jgi:hypothetical protein
MNRLADIYHHEIAVRQDISGDQAREILIRLIMDLWSLPAEEAVARANAITSEWG